MNKSSLDTGLSILRVWRGLRPERPDQQIRSGIRRGMTRKISLVPDTGSETPHDQLPMRLDDYTIDAIVRGLAEMLAANGYLAQSRRLLTAAEVATAWGVDRSWVYEHARELGAIRLGSGPSPRIRFDSAKLEEYLEASTTPPPAPPTRPRRYRKPAASQLTRKPVELLPIKGERPLTY